MTCFSKALQTVLGLFPEILRGEEEAVLKLLLLLLQRLVIVDQFTLEQFPFSVELPVQILHLRAKPSDDQDCEDC